MNPVFLMPGALGERGKEIAKGWAGSRSMGAGQFCTNPSIAVALAGQDAEAFATAAAAALSDVGPQTNLTENIATAYRSAREALSGTNGVDAVLKSDPEHPRAAAPDLFRMSAERWISDETSGHEVFGPTGLLVIARDETEMKAVAETMAGQLTATLHMAESDTNSVQVLLPILERKVGRILFNGFPTGVEVADAMVHGGPYPASTNFGHTSVGTLSIRRWLRPVCYQNLPEALMLADLV